MKLTNLNFNVHYISHQLGEIDVRKVKELDIEDYINWQEYFMTVNGTKKEEVSSDNMELVSFLRSKKK